MREFKKGSLGMLILHLLYERPSYGYELCERLRERSAGTLSFEDGAVYPLLHTLERDGLAEGYWETDAGESSGEGHGTEVPTHGAGGLKSADAASLEPLQSPSPFPATVVPGGADGARKGPRRRYYRLTAKGVQALRAAVEEWSAFSSAVERVIGDQPALGGEGRR